MGIGVGQTKVPQNLEAPPKKVRGVEAEVLKSYCFQEQKSNNKNNRISMTRGEIRLQVAPFTHPDLRNVVLLFVSFFLGGEAKGFSIPLLGPLFIVV